MTEDQKPYKNHTHSNKKPNTDAKVRGLKTDSALWKAVKMEALRINVNVSEIVIIALQNYLNDLKTKDDKNRA